jgi:hypothetical protein
MTEHPPARGTDPAELDELRALGAALARHDGVPAIELEIARESFELRHASLAELTRDSAHEELAGVRALAGARVLSFEAPELSIEVDVFERGDRRDLDGQLAPAAARTVILRHAEGESRVEASAGGRFRFEDVPAGRVRLGIAAAPGQPAVFTPWQTL